MPTSTTFQKYFVEMAFFLSIPMCVCLLINTAWGQEIGEQAELERLQQRAEDAMASGDPDGAALNIGKAAMMASILAKQARSGDQASTFRSLALLFRAQENTYRAFAMFQKAGNRLPAPASVCSSLRLGGHQAKRAQTHLAGTQKVAQGQLIHEQITEWIQTIREVQEDFQCGKP